MKEFGGKALFLDRNDINTDEIIPAKYLTEITKKALAPYILEDLKLEGFDPKSQAMAQAGVIVTRANFGCGSSREHAVWVLEVNNINMVIAEGFARIFRQNMFNCGMLALEMSGRDIDALFDLGKEVTLFADINAGRLTVTGRTAEGGTREQSFSFELDAFDRDLLLAGGWLEYADKNY